MFEYVRYLTSFLEPLFLGDLPRVLWLLLGSMNFYFWLIAIMAIRFSLPDIVLWFAALYDHSIVGNGLAYPTRPVVTVLIAGRNVADTIVPTIRSVLSSGYENVEVIFVDDGSVDSSVQRARLLEKSKRVRVFGTGVHSGKPSSLNIGLNMANGEFTFILDADSEVQVGSISRLLAQFTAQDVGGVAANLRVRNAGENLLTRLQECEYAMNVSVARLWRAKLGIASILPGAGSMFRTQALREIGGFDTGLGDDTDMTLRLRKGRWRLGFAPEAIVWTDVPNRMGWLLRQRSRWARNMVKIRLHKQGDLGNPFRYGLRNAVLFVDLLLVRIIIPFLGLGGAVYYIVREPFGTPILLTGLYWVTLFFLMIRLLIANDLVHTPVLSRLWMIPLYPFYRLPVRIVELLSIIRELLGIRKWHPYVPKKIWQQIKHW